MLEYWRVPQKVICSQSERFCMILLRGKETRLESNYWQMTVKAQTGFGGISWYGVGTGPTKQEAKQNAAVSLIFSWMKRKFPDRDHWTRMKDEMEKSLRLSIPESFKNLLFCKLKKPQKTWILFFAS